MCEFALANGDHDRSKDPAQRDNEYGPAQSSEVLDDVEGIIAHRVKLVAHGVVSYSVEV